MTPTREHRLPPLRVATDALVPRPWGGGALRGYKGLGPDGAAGPGPFGECFEAAADPDDPEARAYASTVCTPEGTRHSLTELIAAAPDALLGAAVHARHGPRLPLLPKTLDVGGLLSVQTHPPGRPELYVVIDCDPDAQLHLGFRAAIDPDAWHARLAEGLARQRELAARMAEAPEALRRELQSWMTRAEAVPLPSDPALRDAEAPLHALRQLCRDLLESLNCVHLAPGDVILNAEPARDGSGRLDAAIHALGDPAGRRALILEIRMPGVTHRAWDHCRFPLRDLDPARALAACSGAATRAEDFRVTPTAIAPGVERLVETPAFDAWRLRPGATAVHRHTQARVRTLHAIGGRAELCWEGGSLLLERGASLVLPASLGPWSLRSAVPNAAAVLIEAAPGDGA